MVVGAGPQPGNCAFLMSRAWARLGDRWGNAQSGLREILESFVLSRLALVMVGWIALGRIPWGYYSPTFNVTTKPWLLMWVRWDALWYLKIAEHGYTQINALAFFPTYPMLIRAVHFLTRLPPHQAQIPERGLLRSIAEEATHRLQPIVGVDG